MYSPVFLSWPTTSGSPPLLSISWSVHSFSAFAPSFACTCDHSRPLWRCMCFSKRAFNTPSSSSRCSGDRSFFERLVAFFMMSLCSIDSGLLSRLRRPVGLFDAELRGVFRVQPLPAEQFLLLACDDQRSRVSTDWLTPNDGVGSGRLVAG